MKAQFRGALVALLLFTLLAVGVAASPLYGTSNFDAIVTDSTIVAGTSIASGTAMNAGTSVGAATSVTAGTFVKSTTYTEVGTLLKLTAATSVTVTNGAAFAIAGAWQPITAAGAVTPTITIPAAGVDACIVNNSAQTVTIADSGNQVLTAAWAGGQYDLLCGHSDGTRFIETGRADN